MDTKYKDDLFRKYVQFHEGKVDTTPATSSLAAVSLLCQVLVAGEGHLSHSKVHGL